MLRNPDVQRERFWYPRYVTLRYGISGELMNRLTQVKFRSR